MEFVVVIPKEALIAGASFFLGIAARHFWPHAGYYAKYGAWPSKHTLQVEACKEHRIREV